MIAVCCLVLVGCCLLRVGLCFLCVVCYCWFVLFVRRWLPLVACSLSFGVCCLLFVVCCCWLFVVCCVLLRFDGSCVRLCACYVLVGVDVCCVFFSVLVCVL